MHAAILPRLFGRPAVVNLKPAPSARPGTVPAFARPGCRFVPKGATRDVRGQGPHFFAHGNAASLREGRKKDSQAGVP
jgi:hypothetical protein